MRVGSLFIFGFPSKLRESWSHFNLLQGFGLAFDHTTETPQQRKKVVQVHEWAISFFQRVYSS
jgi:hypothetical protein